MTDQSLTIARNAVTSVGVDAASLNRARLHSIDHSVSHRTDDHAVANQKKSGRCWIFAGLNSLRTALMADTKIKDFEFSQAYVHFWDKLEKANYFLVAMSELAERDLDDRTVQHLLANPVEDGGQWGMFVALVEKYGVVPKYAMPETWSSSHTDKLCRDLNSLLRKGALAIREADTPEKVEEVRRSYLAQVYRILVIHLGTPPERFLWQYRDKDKTFHREGEYTPTEFARAVLPADLKDYICVVNDPRNPYEAAYTVEYLGNVIGSPVTYVNAPIEVLKRAAASSIVDGHPVWFGCDTVAHSHAETGVWAADLYQREELYGVELDMDKKERLISGESLMTHAMVLTGVDLPCADCHDSAELPEDLEIRRWRVENSWGDEKADKGFWTMDDSWFEPYVYEVAVHPRYLPEAVVAAAKQEPTVLPAWDPMGALA
ncbi:C1 family peptidase [Corynebacterium uropygiale]|uniref:Aminopeptidase n=2 Tax=Corynebacterium uropygiale TaxID=1775911 RepID=A0A9X1QRH3_9CORY|nr:C1 family peptidase [Corynebacterium uropygiale]